MGKDVPLFICGECQWRHAKPNICIVDHDQNNTMLLIQENKHVGTSEFTQVNIVAHLIAEAIAAFTWNNYW